MLAIKKTLSYITITSLLFSNVASAGKDFLSDNQDQPSSVRFKPIIGDRYAHDDWAINTKGTVTNSEGGSASLSRTFKEYVDQAPSHEALQAFLNNAHVYLKGDQLEVLLPLKGGMKRVGKPENNICKYDKTTGVPGTGYCFPLSNGGTGPSGQPNKNSYVGTKRFPELMESQYGPSAKDDFRLPSDKPNPYPSNFDPLAKSTDPFSPNWDPFQPSTKSHYDQFHIPTPVPQQPYTRYELEQIEQLQKKQHALQEQRELEEQRKQQLAQLDHTLQYHKSNGAKVFTTLTASEEGAVIKYAHKVCLEGKCKPDTDALKYAIKQVVYDMPAHHVLGWYQSLDEPGVQFYKNLNKKHSQQIIETAKELAYGQGHKPDSSTITQAYDQVMTGEMRYVFDYHKNQTKAKEYVDAIDIQQNAIVKTALGLMKSAPKKFSQPDTWPLTGAFKEVGELGWNQAALDRYKGFTGNQGSLRYTDMNGNISVLNLKNGLVDPISIADAYKEGAFLPRGFVDQDHYFEKVGMAITNVVGKGVKELWCHTIGVCDVEAVPLALPALRLVGEKVGLSAAIGIGVTYLGDKAIQYSENYTKALGFAFNNMIKNGHLPQQYVVGGAKILAGIIDDSIKMAQTLKTPLFEGTPLELLVTHGVIGAPKMNVTPGHGGQQITLTTPVFDNWAQKERIIHMQVTQEDIAKAESAGINADMRPSKKGDGVEWIADNNPSQAKHVIRIMPGLGEKAPHEAQRDDYVKIVKDGDMRDKDGNIVRSGDNGFQRPRDNPRTHIKKTDWHKWRTALEP